MDAISAVVTLAAVGGALGFVAWPLASPAIREDNETARMKRRVALDEEKERLLASLHDLEHDFSTGKMEEPDYRAISAKLKAETARVLKEIDVNEGRKILRPGDRWEDRPSAPVSSAPITPGTSVPAVPTPPPAPTPAATAPTPTSTPTPAAAPAPAAAASAAADEGAAIKFCTKCGRRAKSADDRFCGRCGATLPDDL